MPKLKISGFLVSVTLCSCSPMSGAERTGSRLGTNHFGEVTPPTSLVDYYSITAGLTGSALKKALHDKIKVSVRLPYARIVYELQYTDADPDHPSNLLMVYSGRSLPAEHGSTDPDESWNREHVWAKSHGFPRTNMPAHTDLHHIRPCEVTLNRQRADFMFAELTSGEAVPSFASALRDAYQGLFSPPAAARGDIARMLFYMDVRYEGDDLREPDLRIVERLPEDVEKGVDHEGSGYHSRLKMLLKWHKDDPVDATERRRNERIFERQKNRNPFIDRPEFAELIYQEADLP